MSTDLLARIDRLLAQGTDGESCFECAELPPEYAPSCSFAALLRELRAVVEERTWRSMDSAPKDGTPILVYDDGATLLSMWVDDEEGSAGWWDNGIMDPPPQFWMPLPEEPR